MCNMHPVHWNTLVCRLVGCACERSHNSSQILKRQSRQATWDWVSKVSHLHGRGVSSIWAGFIRLGALTSFQGGSSSRHTARWFRCLEVRGFAGVPLAILALEDSVFVYRHWLPVHGRGIFEDIQLAASAITIGDPWLASGSMKIHLTGFTEAVTFRGEHKF